MGPWSSFLQQENQGGNQIFSGKSLNSFCFLLFHPPTFSGTSFVKFFYLSTVSLPSSYIAEDIFISPTLSSVAGTQGEHQTSITKVSAQIMPQGILELQQPEEKQ